MHPLLRLIATRPALLAEHAEAYGALIAAELPRVSASWQRRALLGAVALACATVALVLAGVAAMLWAVTPEAGMRAPWALLAVPLLPLLVGLICLIAARKPTEGEPMVILRQQFAADLLVLREAARA
jgi:MFS family permease